MLVICLFVLSCVIHACASVCLVCLLVVVIVCLVCMLVLSCVTHCLYVSDLLCAPWHCVSCCCLSILLLDCCHWLLSLIQCLWVAVIDCCLSILNVCMCICVLWHHTVHVQDVCMCISQSRSARCVHMHLCILTMHFWTHNANLPNTQSTTAKCVTLANVSPDTTQQPLLSKHYCKLLQTQNCVLQLLQAVARTNKITISCS